MLRALCLFFALVSISSGAFAQNSVEVEQLDFANGLFQRGFYDLAITEYNKFIEAYPSSDLCEEAFFGIAECLFFQKDYPRAIDSYKKYISSFPKSARLPMANLRIGQALFYQEKFKESVQYFEKADITGLDDAFKQILNYYSGKAYKNLGNVDKASPLLEKTVSASKKSDYAAFGYIELGDIASDNTDFAKSADYYNKAAQAAVTPETAAIALYKKGQVEFMGGAYEISLETFKKLLDSGQVAPDMYGKALANYLLCLYNLEMYKNVIQEYAERTKDVDQGILPFDVYYVLASSYDELADYEKAIEILDTALSNDRFTPEEKKKARIKKSGILINTKKFGDALSVLGTDETPGGDDSEDVLFMKAEALYGMDKYDEASKAYDKILSKSKGSSIFDSALYSSAFCFEQEGQHEKAVGAFLEYFKTGKIKDKRKEALYNAILIMIKDGKTREAIEYSDIFLKEFPEGDLAPKVMFKMGLLYSELKEYLKAGQVFREYADKYPDSPRLQEVYFQIAYNMQCSGNLDDSLKYYAKITKDKDEKIFYSALKNTAMIYLNDKSDDKAARILSRLIREFKETDLSVDVYLWLAKFYVDGGAYEEALFILKKAEAKAADSVERKKDMAYFRAEANRGLKNCKEAVDDYDIVLDGPGGEALYSAAHIGKGLCLKELKEYDKAIDEFQAAMTESPEDNTVTMRARFEIADAQRLKGNLEEAYKTYMLVAILYDNEQYTSEALFQAGEIFTKLGKNDEAKKAYQEVVNRYPGSPLAEKAKEKLQVTNENPN